MTTGEKLARAIEYLRSRGLYTLDPGSNPPRPKDLPRVLKRQAYDDKNLLDLGKFKRERK